jgi:methionyl-tRNA synthetase
MGYCHLCNVYIQDNKPWELEKTDKDRCAAVVNTGINALRFLCSLLEPFMPSFSAKVYEQMNIKRSEKDETLL